MQADVKNLRWNNRDKIYPKNWVNNMNTWTMISERALSIGILFTISRDSEHKKQFIISFSAGT